MRKTVSFSWGCFLTGVACCLALLAFTGQITCAGIIEIDISETGLAPVKVNLGSGLEGPGTDMNHVTADVAALNGLLHTSASTSTSVL